jgi:hypothetical protein
VSDLEVRKSFVVPQFDVPHRSDTPSDRFIERDDPGVEGWVSRAEKGSDVISVAGQLVESMGESIRGGSSCSVPCDIPISTIFDGLGGLNRAKRDLELSQFLSPDIVVERGVLPAEYGIEVDRSPCDNIFPFGVGEFGAIW